MKQFSDVDPATAKRWLDVPGDWRRPNVTKKFEILWDSSRSYGQIWPRPDHSEVVSYYDVEEYYTHNTSSDKRGQSVGLQQKIQTKLSWLRDKGVDPDAKWWESVSSGQKLQILEVGCGNGSNLKMFQSLGHGTVGVEPDSKALEVARNEGLTVFHGTAETLPAEVVNDQYDVVVFMHVLEHCVDPFLAVKNASECLRPGGRLVAEVPNNECLGTKRFAELWYWLDVPRHLNFFTKSSLGALVLSAGMQVESFFFRGYCRQFSKDWKNSQTHIADTLGVPGDRRVRGASYWRHLIGSAWSTDRHKYDSVRVIAVRP